MKPGVAWLHFGLAAAKRRAQTRHFDIRLARAKLLGHADLKQYFGAQTWVKFSRFDGPDFGVRQTTRTSAQSRAIDAETRQSDHGLWRGVDRGG